MESCSSINTLDVEGMLSHVGDFGKFQFILIFLFSIINSLSAFHYFGQTFTSIEPEFICKNRSVGLENATIIYSSCSYTIVDQSSSNVYPCTDWDFNSNYGYVSMVQELEWICSKDWKASLGQSVFFIGSLVGTLLFGILADRIGRMHVLVMANMFAFFGNLATIFTYDVISYGISRFIAGCASDTNFVMMYMLVMEYIRPSMRTCGLNLTIGIFYCLSSMLVPWIAVLMGNWQLFLLVIAVPHFFVILFYLIVPESAQWLISKGKTEEAITCFKKISKVNNKPISNDAIIGLRLYAKEIPEYKQHESFLGLLKTPKLRRKIIILMFKSMVMNLAYDAIARNINGLGYSPFIIFTATSATIFPGCLIILLLQDRIGRKALASSSFFLGGLFILIAGLILATYTSANECLTLILTVIARLNVIVAYNSGHQYAFELIPTEVRAQGVSVIHVLGFAASFFSPHVIYLSSVWKPFPEILIGVLLMLAAIACLFLPETLNKTLPVTLEDGEMFGEDEAIFEFACFKRPTPEDTYILSNRKL